MLLAALSCVASMPKLMIAPVRGPQGYAGSDVNYWGGVFADKWEAALDECQKAIDAAKVAVVSAPDESGVVAALSVLNDALAKNTKKIARQGDSAEILGNREKKNFQTKAEAIVNAVQDLDKAILVNSAVKASTGHQALAEQLLVLRTRILDAIRMISINPEQFCPDVFAAEQDLTNLIVKLHSSISASDISVEKLLKTSNEQRMAQRHTMDINNITKKQNIDPKTKKPLMIETDTDDKILKDLLGSLYSPATKGATHGSGHGSGPVVWTSKIPADRFAHAASVLAGLDLDKLAPIDLTSVGLNNWFTGPKSSKTLDVKYTTGDANLDATLALIENMEWAPVDLDKIKLDAIVTSLLAVNNLTTYPDLVTFQTKLGNQKAIADNKEKFYIDISSKTYTSGTTLADLKAQGDLLLDPTGSSRTGAIETLRSAWSTLINGNPGVDAEGKLAVVKNAINDLISKLNSANSNDNTLVSNFQAKVADLIHSDFQKPVHTPPGTFNIFDTTAIGGITAASLVADSFKEAKAIVLALKSFAVTINFSKKSKAKDDKKKIDDIEAKIKSLGTGSNTAETNAINILNGTIKKIKTSNDAIAIGNIKFDDAINSLV